MILFSKFPTLHQIVLDYNESEVWLNFKLVRVLDALMHKFPQIFLNRERNFSYPKSIELGSLSGFIPEGSLFFFTKTELIILEKNRDRKSAK